MDEKNRKPQSNTTAEAAGTPAAGRDALSMAETEVLRSERLYLIELISSLTPEQVRQVISRAEKLLPPR